MPGLAALRILSTVLVIVSWCLVTGCSTTRVVLVPDPDGKVGQVTVTTAAGAQVLDQAGESTEAVRQDSVPKEPEILGEERIQGLFGEALANEPLPPVHHRLYFKFDSTVLKRESEPLLPRTVDEAHIRLSCNVNVIGHTDRMGRDGYNRRLSLSRALAVKKRLASLGLAEQCLQIRYYGESDPLIPTPDGKAEPRNRRVEIEIR